jgi:hypothetical protein
MHELDRYGLAEYQYEGVGELRYADRDPVKVYFDARQFSDARLVIGCIATESSLHEDPVELSGRRFDGQSFQAKAPTWVTHHIRSEYQSAQFIADEIQVGADVALPTYRPLRFAVYNFAFGQRDEQPLRPIELESGAFRISISATDDYRKRIAYLRRAGGIGQTAWCAIGPSKRLDGAFPLEEVRSLADEVVDALSLATGTLVSWHRCEGADGMGSKIVRIHRDAISKSFAGLVVTRGWFASTAEVVHAWLNLPADAKLARDDLRVYVRQHCDSCSEDAFFETRALSAATLLDVIAGHYSEKMGADHFVDRSVWKTYVLPALRTTLETSDQLTAEQRQEAIQNLEHQYRRSFKRKLRRLLEDLGVPVKPATLTAAINSRNAVTHTGRFHSAKVEQHFEEYLRLVVLGRCILLAAAGVKNDLHELLSD